MPAKPSDEFSAVHADPTHGIEIPRLSTAPRAEARELILPSLSLPASSRGKRLLEPMRPAGRHDPATMPTRLNGAMASAGEVFEPPSSITPPPFVALRRVPHARVAATGASRVTRPRSCVDILPRRSVFALAPSSRTGREARTPCWSTQPFRPRSYISPRRREYHRRIFALSSPSASFGSAQ